VATKKVTIPRSRLTPVDGENKFLVRFRITSDDRNRLSEWSQIFIIDAQNAQSLYFPEVSSAAAGNIVSIIWQNLPGDTRLDLFLRADGGEYQYLGTTSGNTYSFINSATSTYQFVLQVSSIAKQYSESLKIFESEVIDVV
jgi:hypothetical protein